MKTKLIAYKADEHINIIKDYSKAVIIYKNNKDITELVTELNNGLEFSYYKN